MVNLPTEIWKQSSSNYVGVHVNLSRWLMKRVDATIHEPGTDY